jgi:GGDEF domain-containing protein
VAFLDLLRFQITTQANFNRLVGVDPDTLTDMQRAARFYYLQHQCFGGKVQGQSWGTDTHAPPVNLLRIGAGIIAASVARTLLADRPEDPERLLAGAFSQTSHREAGERRHGELDVLTGLLKLEPFQTALSTSAAHWSPSQNSAVLFIDLDRFHRINEAHGHAVGDTVLQRVADVLRRCTRGHDIVACLGDDDYAVLLTTTSPVDRRLHDDLRRIHLHSKAPRFDLHRPL